MAEVGDGLDGVGTERPPGRRPPKRDRWEDRLEGKSITDFI